MVATWNAIVMHVQPVSDQYVLLHLYTRQGGRRCVKAYGRKWRSTLTPMAIVEVCVSGKSEEQCALTSVARTYVPQHDDMAHHCAYLMMAEVLMKTLVHPMQDEQLYEYLLQQTIEVDERDEMVGWSAAFLYGLSQQLGYGGQWLNEWHQLKSIDLL